MTYGYLEYGDYGYLRGKPGAPSAPSVTLRAPTYSENFNSYADGTRVIAGDAVTDTGFINANPGNLGWTSIRRVAIGDNTSRHNLLVWQGRLVKRTTGVNNTFGYFHTPNVPITGLPTVSAGLKAINSSTWTSMILRAAAEEDLFRVTIEGPNVTLKLDRVAATTPTNIVGLTRAATGRRLGGNNGAFANFNQTNDRVTCIMYNDGTNNKAILRRANGHTLGTATGYTFTDIAGNLFGVLPGSTQNSDGVDFIEAQPTGTVLTVTETFDVFKPCVLGAGGFTRGASYTFAGLYFNGAPAKIQWALFDPETDTVVKDWALVPSGDATIGSGAWSVNIIVPWGLNGRKAYCIGFRPVDGSNVADPLAAVISNREFAPTIGIAAIGQSNANFLADGCVSGSYTNFPGGYHYRKNDPPTLTGTKLDVSQYYENTNATAINGRMAGGLDILTTYFNGPVSFSSIAVPGSTADALGNGGANWSYITTHAANSGPFEYIYLSQGESDSVSVAVASNWSTLWLSYLDDYRALSGQPGGTVIPVFVNLSGRIGTDIPGGREVHRQQDLFLAAAAGDDVYLSNHYVGCTLIDSIHHTAVSGGIGYHEVGRRFALTMRNVLSGTGYNGVGPLFGTPTRSGAVITVPVSLNGATSLEARNGEDQSLTADPNVLRSWDVSVDDFASLLTINSAVLSGSNVVITLSADPGGPVKVRNHANGAAATENITSWVFGAYADGTYIGAKPIFTPLTSN
jgi:hypothetical protein